MYPKNLRLAIMKLTYLAINKIVKKKNEPNLVTKLNKQKNISIISKITLTDSKNFCDKCNNFATSAYFSNKYNSGDSKIFLTENEEIINEKTKAADVFNSYFESVTESLHLFNWPLEPYDQVKDLVDRII